MIYDLGVLVFVNGQWVLNSLRGNMPQVEMITMPKDEFDEMAELILDLFAQGTMLDDEHYNHMCMSSYESAQRWLIKHGLVKPEQCIYQD